MASKKQSVKAAIRRVANTFGYDIVGYDGSNARARLARWLTEHDIAVIFDVGANCGHFGWDMRELGFSGRIVSFEPMQEAFRSLQEAARGDAAWQTVQMGLGARDEERVLNIAANSQSSSFLPMLDAHVAAAPESRYQAAQSATIRRLDGVFGTYCKPSEKAFLKIDTQGFERHVLEGARDILAAVPLVQVECSLVPLYDGADRIEDTIGYLRGLGYDPVDTLPTFHHAGSGHLMQMDMLFLRQE
jgi:FkbM family methyltransferase